MVKEYEPLELGVVAATVSDVLLLNTTTIDVRPLDASVRPFWNPVPLTLKLKLLFFLAHAGLVPLGAVIVGADRGLTVNANGWVGAPVAFVAVNVIGVVPETVGVPVSVPVPFPLSVKVAQLGRPLAERVGTGMPVVVTLKVKL
jgi:hypothetical protein